MIHIYMHLIIFMWQQKCCILFDGGVVSRSKDFCTITFVLVDQSLKKIQFIFKMLGFFLFFFLQSGHLYELLMGNEKCQPFYFERQPKGCPKSEIWHTNVIGRYSAFWCGFVSLNCVEIFRWLMDFYFLWKFSEINLIKIS